jgi:hypothetical protein
VDDIFVTFAAVRFAARTIHAAVRFAARTIHAAVGSRRARSTLLSVFQRTSNDVTSRHQSRCGRSPECAPSRPHVNLGIPCCVTLLRYGRMRRCRPDFMNTSNDRRGERVKVYITPVLKISTVC